MSTAATQQDAAARLDAVRARIAAAAREAGRDPAAVTLIAISKQQSDERIAAVLAAGHRVFGENRVQEAEAHWSARRATVPDLALHMVGPLQTNKVREAVALFDAIHSVDRPRLAEALAKEMARSGRRPACFIEVNTGEEPQKAGVLPADADAFIERCRTEFALPLAGLMCIPPHDAVPAPHFALLATIAKRHGLASLSMGMSADYEAAVTLGATHVRVGTAIFGERAPR
ncbi:MAG: YggS family pyridoxal phosphate-dependent enzyme [Alphaproteobacteria bacterium]